MIEQLRHGLQADVTVEGLVLALAELEDGVPTEELERLAEVLVEVISRVPDGLVHLLALAKDERCGRAVAFATGSILTYLLDPDDLFPESGYGPVGLLDDAYLVHTFAGQLAMTYPFAATDVGYTAPSPQSLAVVAALLPDGVAQALARTSDTIIHVAHALFAPGQAGGPPAPIERLDVRVAEAVAALG